MPPTPRRRYALVGAGAARRCSSGPLATDHADAAELVALADTNPARPAVHNARLRRSAHHPSHSTPPPTSPTC